MGTGARARVGAISVALVLPCCSLLTSTDGLSGGAGADAAADGGAIADVVSEAAEGGAADTAPEAGPTRCTSAELFCADFDEGDVAKGWDGVAVGPGTMTTNGDAFVSPTRSALVTLPATDAYTQAVKLVKTFDGEFTSLRCSFAMRRDVLGAAYVTFASLETRTTNGDRVTLYASANASAGTFTVRRYIAVSDTVVPKEVAAPIAFSPGSWHEVRFEIDRTAGRIVVDGKPIASLTHDTVSAPLGATFALGGVEMDPKNGISWKFRLDDVRCDRTP